MTPDCRELEVLRSLHAAGGLEGAGAEAARVATHLEACAACREAERQDRELLDRVRLPAPGPAEGLAVADLPGRVLRALRRRERRLTWLRRAGAAAGIAAAAAAVLAMLLLPAITRSPGFPEAGAVHETAARAAPDGAAWDEDDLDTEDSSSTASSETELALAAYDAGVGD